MVHTRVILLKNILPNRLPIDAELVFFLLLLKLFCLLMIN